MAWVLLTFYVIVHVASSINDSRHYTIKEVTSYE